jgi:hypothetical protein
MGPDFPVPGPFDDESEGRVYHAVAALTQAQGMMRRTRAALGGPPVAAFSCWGLDTWLEQDPSWRKQAECRGFWSAEGGAKTRGRSSQHPGSANPLLFLDGC